MADAVHDLDDCRFCEAVIEPGDTVGTVPTGNAVYECQEMKAPDDRAVLHISTDGEGEVFHAECLYSRLGLLDSDDKEGEST